MGFTYEMPVEVLNPKTGEYEEWDLEIRAGYSTPARRHGHPDTWAPAEGGELEFNVVRRDNEVKEFKDFCTEYSVDGSLVDTWYDQAEDRYSDALADHEEYLAECRHDDGY